MGKNVGFKFFLGISSGLVIWTACERPSRVETARWHGDGPMPAVPSGIDTASVQAQSDSEKMHFQTQTVGGIQIENSYFKSIDKDGKPFLMTYRWLPGSESKMQKKVQALQRQLPTMTEIFLSHYPKLKERKILSGPEVAVQATSPVRFGWKIILEEKDGSLLELRLSEDQKRFETRRLGSQFADASAFLFPKGPLKSEVTDVWLRNLLSAQKLESDQVLVRTESDQPALAEKNQFRYTSEDPRFSQVQAFYFATESLKWFSKQWGFELPFRLEVETQKGFPQKTNTAFYFQHKIRLGDGDDQTYARIPLDPSIVLHESVHAVVEAVAGLPYEGEGGSLNEAFADYFAATQLDNPRMGEASYRKEAFKRSLQNDGKKDQKNGGLYHDSLLVSGWLWNIRTVLGEEVGNRIAWKTLMRLTPESDFENFREELFKVLGDESQDVQNQVRTIAQTRGWN